MKLNEKLTVEWNKTYSTNFYSISRDANPPIKRPDFNAVLYNNYYMDHTNEGIKKREQ